jgi:uncharacterized protein YjbJ (UPF0337 family)
MTTAKNTHEIPAKGAMPQPTPAFNLPDGEALSHPAAAASTAAKGDDSLMGQPSDINVTSKCGRGPWSTQVGAARAEWTKISADELLKTNGQAADLASLVEKRYGVKRSEADGQVARFLARHKV